MIKRIIPVVIFIITAINLNAQNIADTNNYYRFREQEVIIKFKQNVKITEKKKFLSSDTKGYRVNKFNGLKRELNAVDVVPVFEGIEYPSSTDRIFRPAKIRQLKHQPFENIVKIDLEGRISREFLDSIYTLYDNIEYIEPNYITEIEEYIPNDSYLNLQWHLGRIEAFKAWEMVNDNTDVKIGILDTGVDYLHQDLAPNIWINSGEDINNNGTVDPEDMNGDDDDGNGYVDDIRGWDFVSVTDVANGEDPGPPDNDPMDVHGHGTHTSGIASAVINNNEGVAGLGWNCTIVPLRAGYKIPGGNGNLTDSDIAEGVRYAANNGVDILSMSFGGPASSEFMKEVFEYAHDSGVILIASAGNDNSTQLAYPAAYDHVIAVASIEIDDKKAYYSNYGKWIDVSAPGSNIYSTIPGNQYEFMSGTSMAAPLVSGLAGLIKSRYPDWTADKISAQIIGTANNIDENNKEYIGKLGSGIIDAFDALSLSPKPLIKLKDFEFEETLGNNDNYPDIGETLILTAKFTNIWEDIENGAYALVSTEDTCLSITNDSILIGKFMYNDIIDFISDISINTLANEGDSVILKYDFYNANGALINTVDLAFVVSPLIKNHQGFPVFIDRNIVIRSIKSEDLDNDGKNEIILASEYGGIMIINSEGKIKDVYSPYIYDLSLPLDIVIGDVNNDGIKEIIGTVYDTKSEVINIYAWNKDGKPLKGFPVKYNWDRVSFHQNEKPLLADLDNDGFLEIILAYFHGKVYILNLKKGLEEYNLNTWSNLGEMKVSVADVNMDSYKDLVMAKDDSICIYTYGTKTTNLISAHSNINSIITLADMDGDKDLEFAYTTVSGNIVVSHHDGTILDGWPQKSQFVFPIIADINLDSVPEIIADDIIAYNLKGEKLFSSTDKYNIYFENSLAADFNGNDTLDLVYIKAQDELGFISNRGEKINDIIKVNNSISSNPIVSDINGDGKTEIIIPTWAGSWSSAGGFIHVLDVNCKESPKGWKSINYDNYNSNYQNEKYKDLPPGRPVIQRVNSWTKDSVNITWNNNAESDIAFYSLFRSVNNKEFTKVTDIPIYKTSYIDRNVNLDSSYQYYLCATDNKNQQSSPSDTVSLTLTDPCAPKNLTLFPLHNGIFIQWLNNGEPDMKQYGIYISNDGENFNYYATSKFNYYFDTINAYATPVYYYVTAIDSSNNESAKSEIVTGKSHIFKDYFKFKPTSEVFDNAYGDINNDGYEDVIQIEGDLIISYLNRSDGYFNIHQKINYQNFAENPLGSGYIMPVNIETADINNDSYLDLFIGTGSFFYGLGTIEIKLNDGNGNFDSSFLVIDKYISTFQNIEVEDIDNDGDKDIIAGAGLKVNINSQQNDYVETKINFAPEIKSLLEKNLKINNSVSSDGEYPLLILKNVEGEFVLSDQILHVNDFNSVKIIDINNDSYKDMILSHKYYGDEMAKIYLNNGLGKFDMTQSLNYHFSVNLNQVESMDLDHDGFEDIAIGNSNGIFIYKNDGSGQFNEEQHIYTSTFEKLASGNIFYNKEMDLVAGGWGISIFQNKNPLFNQEYSEFNGNNKTKDIKLADFDNDGDLDIYTMTEKEGGQVCLNTTSWYRSYNIPIQPNNLNSVVNDNTVNLSWSKATDGETYQNLIKYNIRVGTIPGKYDIISGINEEAGIETNNIELVFEKSGIYYWSVQAVDGQKNHSAWSSDLSFTITDKKIPSIVKTTPASNQSNVSLSSPVSIVFSEPIDTHLLKIYVRNSQNDTINGVITSNTSNNIVTFKPCSLFNTGDTLTVIVRNIKDKSGNVGADSTWKFSTKKILLEISNVEITTYNGEINTAWYTSYDLYIKNKGTITAENVIIEVKHKSDYVMYYSSYVSVGNIDPGQEIKNSMFFITTHDCPSGYQLTLYYEVKDHLYDIYYDTVIFQPVIDREPPYVNAITLNKNHPETGDSVKITAEIIEGSGIKKVNALIYDWHQNILVGKIPMHFDKYNENYVAYFKNYKAEKYYYVQISATDSLDNYSEGYAKTGFSTKSFDTTRRIILLWDSPKQFVQKYEAEVLLNSFKELPFTFDYWVEFFDGPLPSLYWTNFNSKLIICVPGGSFNSIEKQEELSKFKDFLNSNNYLTLFDGNIAFTRNEDVDFFNNYLGLSGASTQFIEGSGEFFARPNEIISDYLQFEKGAYSMLSLLEPLGSKPFIYYDSIPVAVANENENFKTATVGFDFYNVNSDADEWKKLFNDLVVWFFSGSEDWSKPQMVADQISMSENESLSFNLNTFFKDEDGDKLNYQITIGSVNIESTIASDSILILEPINNWHGKDKLVISCSDGFFCITDTLYVTVNPVHHPPVITDFVDNLEISKNSNVSYLLHYNDPDPDDVHSFYYSTGSGENNVVITIDSTANGLFYLKINSVNNWVGDDVIYISVKDPADLRDSDTLFITVSDILSNMEKFETPQFMIYPNPVRDFIFIENKEFSIDIIDFIDVNGQKIRYVLKDGTKSTSINTESLPYGHYNVIIYHSGGYEVHRILIAY